MCVCVCVCVCGGGGGGGGGSLATRHYREVCCDLSGRTNFPVLNVLGESHVKEL